MERHTCKFDGCSFFLLSKHGPVTHVSMLEVWLRQWNPKEAIFNICLTPTLRLSSFGEKGVERPRIDNIVQAWHNTAETDLENVDEALWNGIINTEAKSNVKKQND